MIKKVLIVAAGMALYSIPAHAVNNLSPNSRITISTQTASPTQVFSSDSLRQGAYIINNSGADIGCAELSTSLSTSTAHIPTSSYIRYDAYDDPWKGPLWCISFGASPVTIDVIGIR